MQKYIATALKNAIKSLDSVAMDSKKYGFDMVRYSLWEVLDDNGWNFNESYRLYKKKGKCYE